MSSSSRSRVCAAQAETQNVPRYLTCKKPARLIAVAGRVGFDDVVDHHCASNLVQCIDVLDDFMRDPVALGLVLGLVHF